MAYKKVCMSLYMGMVYPKILENWIAIDPLKCPACYLKWFYVVMDITSGYVKIAIYLCIINSFTVYVKFL